MKTYQVGDLKTRFSDIINDVRNGQEIGIAYGKSREKVAVIVPYKQYMNKKAKRRIGIAGKSATYRIEPDFEMADTELTGN